MRWCKLAATALLAVTAAATPVRAEGPRVIEIAAKRFAFTPAEITLRAGEPVVLRVTSGDVTHGFYQKALGLDATLEPGKTLELPLTPAASGRYEVICDHFCGAGHGNMHMTIVVQ